MFLEGIIYETIISDHQVIFLISQNINYAATSNYKWPVSSCRVIYTKMMVCFNESQMLLELGYERKIITAMKSEMAISSTGDRLSDGMYLC